MQGTRKNQKSLHFSRKLNAISIKQCGTFLGYIYAQWSKVDKEDRSGEGWRGSRASKNTVVWKLFPVESLDIIHRIINVGHVTYDIEAFTSGLQQVQNRFNMNCVFRMGDVKAT